jgi:hypothetical protein
MAGNHSAHQAAAPTAPALSTPVAARPARPLAPVAPEAPASALPSPTIRASASTATQPAPAWPLASTVPAVLQGVSVP